MKRIVSMLLCLAMLLCSVAALADAPKVEAMLPAEVDYGTQQHVFTFRYNGSNYKWTSVWLENGEYVYDNSGYCAGDELIGANFPGNPAVDEWFMKNPGKAMPQAFVITGKDFKPVFVDFFGTYYEEGLRKFIRLTKDGGKKMSDLIDLIIDKDGNVSVKEKTYTHNNIRSFGPRFKDVDSKLTKKWYRFTPVDLSKDGTQTFDMISGDHYVIGKVKVTVKGDTVKVTYKYDVDEIWDWKNYKFYTFFSDFDSVTEVEPEKITNRFEYGKEYSIEKDLKGDTDVLLYLGNKATHNDNKAKLTIFRETYKPYAKLCNEMLEMIGKTLAE